MLKTLRKRSKAQNTAEYTILLALVVGAFITMQTWVKRSLQGRVRDASLYRVKSDNGLWGNSVQFEPDYLRSSYWVGRQTLRLSAWFGRGPNLKTWRAFISWKTSSSMWIWKPSKN
jgi:hypothetical protein